MSKGKVRHMFPGGNTSQGFFSYYDYILSQEEATRIISIKGGPGVGKSTFMKKIGNEMIDRGYDVEFMHCSSDNNSLDGVVIPAIKVALIDGTAPHVVDPKNPGAVDEIIHLGDFWNEEGMRENREAILKYNKEVGRTFARAYRYIKAAYPLYEDNSVITGWCIDSAKVNATGVKLVDELFKDTKIAAMEGKDRRLFASAITPNGLVNYLSTVLDTDKVYVLEGKPGTGTEKVLEKVKTAAVERGFNVESYYCALNPLRLEHLVIADLDVSLTTSCEYHDACVDAYATINLNEYIDESMQDEYQDILEANKSNFDSLLDMAVKTIAKAKALHDDMEAYYIPNMDFEAVQRCWESTMARIFQYAEESKLSF
ncbi:MAG: PRK06851 family protein [Bacillota bacterium]